MPRYKSTELNILVGERIKKLRKIADITQEMLSEGLAITRVSMVNIEKGRQSLTLKNLYEISYILGCNPGDLLPDLDEVIEEKDLEEIFKQIKGNIPKARLMSIRRLIRVVLEDIEK